MAAKHVVIGGGTGYIGKALAYAFKNVGSQVTIISRKETPDTITWSNVIRDGLPKNTTHVINVAGQNVLDPTKRWCEDFKDEVWDSRVKTTKWLADAVQNSDTKCFVTISGVAYYPPNEKEHTEHDKCGKYDFLSELTHAWEAAAKLPPETNCRKVTIRSGVVLGRTGGMIQQLFFPFFFGFGGPIGNGKQFLPWIHISDLVNLFMFASEKDNVTGVLNGVAPEIITNKQFARAFGRAMWKPAFLPLPAPIVNFIYSTERAKIMLEGQKVIPKRVLEYGFKYEYPEINLACQQFSELFYPYPY